MSKLTHQNIYTLINDLITKRIGFDSKSGYSNSGQTGRVSIAPLTSSREADIGVAALVQAVQTILKSSLESRIISGLNVTETDPVSNSIVIVLGKGSASGELYTLSANVTIEIPFNDFTNVFYVNLYQDRILIEQERRDDRLSIAKIVVPNPGTTNRVKDNKKDDFPWDAYIVNFKKYFLYGDVNGKLEEDSIEFLRDNINPIISDNLIGNIKLREDLKITNTQGTLEINSKELKILDINSVILSKFNRNGTFFYNTSGVELARFTRNDARIGNILITTSSVETGNFISGSLGTGFRIKDNGDAEFNNVIIRGKFKTSTFEHDTISNVGGSLLVMDGDILDADMIATGTTLTISGDTTFAVNDILRIKDGVDDEWLKVTNVGSAPTYTIERDKDSAYGHAANPAWKKGTAVVNYGASGEGGIYMTSSESNAPYISIVTHAGSPWSSLTTKIRLGNLNGFLGYSSDKYGIAIGESAKYLKYDSTNGLRIAGHTLLGSLSISTAGYINSGQSAYDNGTGFWLEYNSGTPRISIGNSSGNKVTWDGSTLSVTGSISLANNASTNGAGLYIGADYLGYYSGSTWNAYIKSDGTFKFLGSSTKYIQWDGSDLKVMGGILATSTSGARVEILPDVNTGLIIYDNTSTQVFKALIGGTDVGDVILGGTNSYVKWDKSTGSLIIQSKAISPVSNEKMVFQDNTFKIYDESGNERVIIGKIA